MTAEEYGRQLAEEAGPLTPEQVEGAARILAPLAAEQQDSSTSSTPAA